MFLQICSNMVGKSGPLFRVNICRRFRNSSYFFMVVEQQTSCPTWAPCWTPGITLYPANGRPTPKLLCTVMKPKSHSNSVNTKEGEKPIFQKTDKQNSCLIPKNNKSPWGLQSFYIKQSIPIWTWCILLCLAPTFPSVFLLDFRNFQANRV